MTKPDWCPPDVWESAGQVIVALENEFVDFSNDGRITTKNMDVQYDVVQNVIARAILAERERAWEAIGLLINIDDSREYTQGLLDAEDAIQNLTKDTAK